MNVISSFVSLFLVTFLCSICLLYLYLKLGNKLKIYDVPNQRSSHLDIVIRGGGIVLLILNLAWILIDSNVSNILLSVSLSIGVMTGFIDDFKSLNTKTRFILYLIAVAIILLGVLALHRFDTFIWIPLFIIILGAVNTYNFMDGINGITTLYSVVILSCSLFILNYLEDSSFDLNIISYIGFFIAFAVFNFRHKALMFLGDSGSVAMGLFAAFLVVLIGMKLNSWSSIILLSVYGVDSVGTIVIRLIKRENILTAHRSHLYQDLVHINGHNHLKVSIWYSIAQLFVNAGWMMLYKIGWIEFYAVIVLLILAIVYYLMKKSIHGGLLFH